jgi:curli biogenesis system outer membrane secretion channel CsgG
MPLAKIFSGLLLSLASLFISCASPPISSEKGNTLAVWDLDDLSPYVSSRPQFGELLSGQVIETLQKRGDYTIVERERLLLALEELQLGSSSLVDEATRLKLGKLIGAGFMVFGGYQVLGDKIRVDLRMVEVETGKVLKAVQRTESASDLQGWADAVRKAAEEL